MPFQRELVEQRGLIDLPLPHHRLPPSRRDLRKSSDYTTAIPEFFNTIAPEQPLAKLRQQIGKRRFPAFRPGLIVQESKFQSILKRSERPRAYDVE